MFLIVKTYIYIALIAIKYMYIVLVVIKCVITKIINQINCAPFNNIIYNGTIQ